jgi:hypothetical protein
VIFDEVNLRRAGFDADVTAVAQHWLRFTLSHFDAHRTRDADGFALDDADDFRGRFIRAGRRSKARREEKKCSRRENRSPRDSHCMQERRHSAILPATSTERAKSTQSVRGTRPKTVFDASRRTQSGRDASRSQSRVNAGS